MRSDDGEAADGMRVCEPCELEPADVSALRAADVQERAEATRLVHLQRAGVGPSNLAALLEAAKARVRVTSAALAAAV